MANNLGELDVVLQDPLVWGLPRERCEVVEPKQAVELFDAVQRAARHVDEEQILLVYYAGHGVVGWDDQLYLTVAESQPGEKIAVTAVPWTLVRDEIRRSCARAVVVLDCCYSGRAAAGGMSGHDVGEVVRGQVGSTQGYVLTATPANARALDPADLLYTAFTGELIALLTSGLPGGPERLTLNLIHKHLKHAMNRVGAPIPQTVDHDGLGEEPLFGNRAAHTSGQTTSAPRSPAANRTPGSGGYRRTALRPFQFAGRPYRDPAHLAEAMNHDWPAARDLLLGEHSVRLTQWLRDDVEDQRLPINWPDISTTVSLDAAGSVDTTEVDLRIATFIYRFAPDTRPHYQGWPVDADGLDALCDAVAAGDPAAVAAAAGLSGQLIEVFARFDCATHAECMDTAGCRILTAVADPSDWPPAWQRTVQGLWRDHTGSFPPAQEYPLPPRVYGTVLHALLHPERVPNNTETALTLDRNAQIVLDANLPEPFTEPPPPAPTVPWRFPASWTKVGGLTLLGFAVAAPITYLLVVFTLGFIELDRSAVEDLEGDTASLLVFLFVGGWVILIAMAVITALLVVGSILAIASSVTFGLGVAFFLPAHLLLAPRHVWEKRAYDRAQTHHETQLADWQQRKAAHERADTQRLADLPAWHPLLPPHTTNP